jgi:uncharacterized membrane protein YeaQ/YmgE (transglycosylase-associated protein family)
MHIIWIIIVGFLAGLLAKFIHPAREHMGFIITTLCGIAGSLLATYAGQALGVYKAGQAAGFIGAVIGAVVILFIYGFVAKKMG